MPKMGQEYVIANNTDLETLQDTCNLLFIGGYEIFATAVVPPVAAPESTYNMVGAAVHVAWLRRRKP
jgi:hypothetical protein